MRAFIYNIAWILFLASNIFVVRARSSAETTSTNISCGAACLVRALILYRLPESVIQSVPNVDRPLNLLEIKQYAERCNLKVKGIKITSISDFDLNGVIIAHQAPDHFILIERKLPADEWQIFDPNTGLQVLSTKKLLDRLTGPGLLFQDSIVFSGGPIISTSVSAISLESIDKNGIQPFTFTICNSGDSPLYIDRINVSCGCIHISSAPKTIQSGAHAEVQGYVKPNDGAFFVKEEMLIQSNDKSQPVANVKISGFVKEDHKSLMLPKVLLGHFSEGDKIHVRKKIALPQLGDDLSILNCFSSDKRFTITASTEQSCIIADITGPSVDSDVKAGDFVVTFNCKSSEAKVSLNMPCFFVIQPILCFDRSYVFYGLVHHGSWTEQTVRLKQCDMFPSNKLTAKIESSTSASVMICQESLLVYRIRFKSDTRGRFDGRLVISGNADNGKPLTASIPFYAYVD